MSDDNLPVPRNAQRVKRLRDTTRALQNGDTRVALTPLEAHDVGNTGVQPNPRADDLGYSTDVLCVTSNLGGTNRVMYEEGTSDTFIDCDADTFIERLSDWA